MKKSRYTQMTSQLVTSARRAKDISLIGFIFLAVMALVTVGCMVAFSSGGMNPVGYLLLYLLFIVVCAVPVGYLHWYSVRIRKALAAGDSHTLVVTFRSLKVHRLFVAAIIAIELFLFEITSSYVAEKLELVI